MGVVVVVIVVVNVVGDGDVVGIASTRWIPDQDHVADQVHYRAHVSPPH